MRKPQKYQEKPKKWARWALLIVGAVAALVVVVNAVAGILYNPNEVMKGRFQDMAKDYYEEYFWQDISDKTALEKYSTKGLRISLGTMLLYDSGKNAEMRDYFKKFGCDTDKTYAKIYPTDPYGQADYEMEVEYYCEI